MSLAETDAAFLIARPEFRRFLHAAIQGAGLLGQQAMASGADSALLAFLEGRRSLGFDLIALAHRGQEQAVRSHDPLGLTTLQAVLDAALCAKENRLERPYPRTRYDELPDPDGADAGANDDASGGTGQRRFAPPAGRR
ncbi:MULTISPECIES: hypothetical protein [unclassified Novosphingobium]|uniref:hypothetical protein n=1 Tax=unclassified Novosphingobium TaxID=2644732 RepID=UPI000D2F7625|nr:MULTISPECIES: hypothetical protein [unclassified Novosphingobium]PTR06970.1 hypothetical protein C8K11_11722 [Novosphingobium sp. GV055]PUA99878.1 hypothetical protein C8K12_11771 [Novosphingobium sp. GV061]PUB14712.1 hypothetical protein C8K14_11722 [Novosphingobium sp. GV079]PUB38942.1 hypothetical protein C8K10_11771 [Novosphingobium sp. GV027]